MHCFNLITKEDMVFVKPLNRFFMASRVGQLYEPSTTGYRLKPKVILDMMGKEKAGQYF